MGAMTRSKSNTQFPKSIGAGLHRTNGWDAFLFLGNLMNSNSKLWINHGVLHVA
jgi:hypothetical protein